MGFLDNPFGGLFDFNRDGHTDMFEAGLGFAIMQDLFEDDEEEISTHFAKNELIGMATDVPIWNLELFNTTGEVFRYTGPMLRKFHPFFDVISDKLRLLLKKEHLFAFDGEP